MLRTIGAVLCLSGCTDLHLCDQATVQLDVGICVIIHSVNNPTNITVDSMNATVQLAERLSGFSVAQVERYFPQTEIRIQATPWTETDDNVRNSLGEWRPAYVQHYWDGRGNDKLTIYIEDQGEQRNEGWLSGMPCPFYFLLSHELLHVMYDGVQEEMVTGDPSSVEMHPRGWFSRPEYTQIENESSIESKIEAQLHTICTLQ